jgi:DNA-binding transcriptional ArsR family regulator
MEALAVLGDDTRRHIVELLAVRDWPSGSLADQFTVSRPAISRHLRVLREAGLVTSHVRGQQRVYSLNAAPLDELDRWLSEIRRFWSRRLDALEIEVLRDSPS